MKILFPERTDLLYRSKHFKYLRNIFKYVGVPVESMYEEKFTPIEFDAWKDLYSPGLNHKVVEKKSLGCSIDGKRVVFEMSHFKDSECTDTTFAYHCYGETENVHSFSPTSFLDWAKFYSMKPSYAATGIINCRQRVPGDVFKERIQNILSLEFPGRVRFDMAQNQLLEEVGKCFVAVRLHKHFSEIGKPMLDAEQLQYMGLGVCTISPNLPEILPYGREIVAGEHYIRCMEDYSDLVELIHWCEMNRTKCVEIGSNARKLFLDTSTPTKLVEWIETVTN